jgi:hypothetical protein
MRCISRLEAHAPRTEIESSTFFSLRTSHERRVLALIAPSHVSEEFRASGARCRALDLRSGWGFEARGAGTSSPWEVRL